MISMGNSPDIIKDASETLKPVSGRGITVMQGWYDKDIKACHVTLWDLGETDDNFSPHEIGRILFRGQERRRFRAGGRNLYESTEILKIL